MLTEPLNVWLSSVVKLMMVASIERQYPCDVIRGRTLRDSSVDVQCIIHGHVRIGQHVLKYSQCHVGLKDEHGLARPCGGAAWAHESGEGVV